MKETLAGIGIFLAFVLFTFGLVWVIQGQNFFLYQFWAPKYEDARRNVYEHTQSYEKGTDDRLAALCNQVSAAADDQKGLLRQQIAQEFSSINTSSVPDYLQGCLIAARGN